SRVDALVATSSRVAEIYAGLGVDPGVLRTVPLTLAHVDRLSPRVIAEPPAPVRFVTLTGAQSEQKGALVLLAAAEALQAAGHAGDRDRGRRDPRRHDPRPDRLAQPLVQRRGAGGDHGGGDRRPGPGGATQPLDPGAPGRAGQAARASPRRARPDLRGRRPMR